MSYNFFWYTSINNLIYQRLIQEMLQKQICMFIGSNKTIEVLVNGSKIGSILSFGITVEL